MEQGKEKLRAIGKKLIAYIIHHKNQTGVVLGLMMVLLVVICFMPKAGEAVGEADNAQPTGICQTPSLSPIPTVRLGLAVMLPNQEKDTTEVVETAEIVLDEAIAVTCTPAPTIKIPEVVVAPVKDKEDSKPVKKQEEVVEKVTTEEVVTEAEKTTSASELSLGIDVSKWQGAIDWAKVASDGVEFAMIRVGYRGRAEGNIVMDPYFEANIKGALRNGIEVGIYFFSQAIDEEEALEEAAWVCAAIKHYNISYPVAYDLENVGQYRIKDVTKTQLTDNALVFLDYVKSQGYEPMMYACKYDFMNYWETGRINCRMWLAHYVAKTNYTGRYDMWQYTSSGTVKGINGDVDMNIAYFRYDTDYVYEEEEINPEEGYSFTEVNQQIRCTATVVNVRTAPDTTLPNVLGQVKTGDLLLRTAIGDNGWSRVTYNGETAYVYSAYFAVQEDYGNPDGETGELTPTGEMASCTPGTTPALTPGTTPSLTPGTTPETTPAITGVISEVPREEVTPEPTPELTGEITEMPTGL